MAMVALAIASEASLQYTSSEFFAVTTFVIEGVGVTVSFGGAVGGVVPDPSVVVVTDGSVVVVVPTGVVVVVVVGLVTIDLVAAMYFLHELLIHVS